MISYRTVKTEYIHEISEKHSRFIAYLCHAASEDEALKRLEEVKARHKTARHNVYAYRIRDNNITRYSDDGEPHGTGGKPVLDIITGNGLTDVLIVVTRYFGGILLGTGGLQRAYSDAASGAVRKSETVLMTECFAMSAEADYSLLYKLQYILSMNAAVSGMDYGEKVRINFNVSADKKAEIVARLREYAGNSVLIEEHGEGFMETVE